MKAGNKQSYLRVGRRSIETLFGLRDENEKALTYTLGYMIAKSPHFREKLFKHAQIKLGGITSVGIEQTDDNTGDSRYDVRVMIDGQTRLIIEGKIWENKPNPDQCYKYVNNLPRTKIKEKQSLLLIFDNVKEENIKECVSSIKIYLNKKSKHKFGDYVCRPLTWDKILDWCKKLKNDNSVKDGEKLLLQHYKYYLESERYSHESLDDLNFPEQQVNQLKYLMDKLVKLVENFKSSDIIMIPCPGSWGNYHYYGYEEDGYEKGFIGYQIAANDVFGLIFRTRGDSANTELYIAFPKDLPSELLPCFNELKINKQAYKFKNYPEYRFKMANLDEKSASQLVDKLEKAGFFKQAIERAK